MTRSCNVGIDLDVFDAFRNPRKKASKPEPKKPAVNVYRAARQLERLIPNSSVWRRTVY